MAIPILGLHRKIQTNKFPPLMERAESQCESEHVIDIISTTEASSSTSTQDRPINCLNSRQNEDLPSTNVRTPVFQHALSTASGTSTGTAPLVRRSNAHGRRRSPLNSGYWICFELLITVSQIIAAIVVLSLSRHEDPHTPLRTWIYGYTSGCVAILPLLFWRYRNRNQSSEQDSSQSRQGSQNTSSARATTYALSSNTRASEGDDHSATGAASRVGPLGGVSPRFKALIEYFKMGLDCFFAVWFVVGNVWIFGGHTSSSVAPNLYRLCIVFLTFSCIGYAMPFILCATICCCLPCIISVLGFREDLTHNRGATAESINALPIYKFKIKKIKNGYDKENAGSGDGGVVAAGTDKERIISGEDAGCCICLAKYANNDELRELPCSHFFHKDCVDKWLKMNASCPLCKADVGENILSSLSEATADLRRNTLF